MWRRLLTAGGLTLLLAWVFSVPVRAQVKAQVDWSKGVVKAVARGVPKEGITGVQGRILAERAAKVTALRDMVEFLQGVHVTAETIVEDAALKSDVIRARVDAVIKQARQVGETQFDADGVATVTMAVNLNGNLADVLLPQEGFGSAAPVPEAPAETPATLASGVSGLIVDARGLNLISAMVPKVMDPEGQIVYGPKLVNRETAVQNGGLAGYEKDLEAAKKNDRVGDNPLVVKGIEARGTYKANLALSSEDAQKVREAAEGRTFLNQCRVVIVVD